MNCIHEVYVVTPGELHILTIYTPVLFSKLIASLSKSLFDFFLLLWDQLGFIIS